jgi:hypothetical protein
MNWQLQSFEAQAGKDAASSVDVDNRDAKKAQANKKARAEQQASFAGS